MSWEAKGRVFEKSYDEVLAALKHQDDKLNRTLTAIAFLTAAGVAIFANVAGKSAPSRFTGELAVQATTFFFIVFLVSVVFALVFALAAIGPSEALPRLAWSSPPPRTADGTWPSLLFYARILNDAAWGSYVNRDVLWLEEALARAFHEESRNLAQRVDFKVARSRESGAFVQLAVLSLSLLGIFSVGHLSLNAKWWIAAGLLIAMLALPLWDGFLMRTFNFKNKRQMQERMSAYLAAAGSAVFGAVLLVTAPEWHSHWWAIFYTLGTILATRLAIAYERQVRLHTILLIGTALFGPPAVIGAAWLN